jgi:immune inhibitor A
MSERSARQRRLRLAAIVPTVALAASGLATAGTMGSATAAPTPEPSTSAGLGHTYYMNYAAPQVEKAYGSDKAIATLSKGKKIDVNDVAARAEAFDAKHAAGNPVTARELAKLEAKAIKSGKSPKAIKSQYKGAKATQEAKLLTILVEFNEEASDDFSGVMVPEYFGATTCKSGDAAVKGPLHNKIPNPADGDNLDNNSFWVNNFSSEHFDKMLFTDEGITERVRPDLTGPDGKAGIDISGYTMKAMYEEMSKGAYTVTGEATPWVTVDHSEGWYGASVCHLNDKGVYEAGAIQDMQGHPENKLGPGQLPIDAVNELADKDPDFPWADYDIEDQGDLNGNGNYNEPDGIIDHVVLVHAGADKSGGGGAEGTYAIWAHSSAVPGGAPIPNTDLKLSNYIVQPEDSGVGVFAHEYGHDLGLPDLYDTSGGGDSDVDFWDLMSSGSHAGPIFQSMPTHMGLWDKWVLGWADPVQIKPGADPKDVIVGQSSRPLKGTADGVKINLPIKTVTLAKPRSGANMWWGNNDQSWAKNTITREVTVPASSDAKFWMWNDYVIEKDWDFGFVEVSTDGGDTWTPQKVYSEAGTEVSTPDGYSDPHGNLEAFGQRKYGLTASSEGWRHDYINLGSWAGQTIQVRLLMSTDAAFTERGWFADDFSVTGAAGATTWSDDVESGVSGWSASVGNWVTGEALGSGWVIDTGTSTKAHYYLVEWRNFDGFDEGLKYAYDTTYQDSEGQWKVEKIKYNAPGALVWYRDTTWGNANHVTTNEHALPSYGAKGGLLIVDSHFDPLRRTGEAATLDPTTLNVMPSRAQSSNAAFGLVETYPFTECLTDAELTERCTDLPALSPVSTFTDKLGWVPGFALRESDGALFYRDRDASAVVPSVGNAPYTVPLYDLEGNRLPAYDGLDIGLGPFGSGNPADSGVAFNTIVTVAKSMFGDQAAQINITPPTP